MQLFRKRMEDYKGRHIGGVPGTHAGLSEMILKSVRSKSGVLDIGAHSGAFLLRLQDQGFSDLNGMDLDETRFDVPGANFLRYDLNLDFADELQRTFNLIIATDVIEHLDSPRQFLSQLWKLLEDDGIIALSFPNIAFWEGRVKFLLKGELWGFGAKNYINQRHVSPMTFEQTELMLREIGFEVLELDSVGNFATVLRRIAMFPIWFPLRLIGGPRIFGEAAVFVARKTEPDNDLLRPVHYRDRWKGVPDNIGLEG